MSLFASRHGRHGPAWLPKSMRQRPLLWVIIILFTGFAMLISMMFQERLGKMMHSHGSHGHHHEPVSKGAFLSRRRSGGRHHMLTNARRAAIEEENGPKADWEAVWAHAHGSKDEFLRELKHQHLIEEEEEGRGHHVEGSHGSGDDHDDHGAAGDEQETHHEDDHHDEANTPTGEPSVVKDPFEAVRADIGTQVSESEVNIHLPAAGAVGPDHPGVAAAAEAVPATPAPTAPAVPTPAPTRAPVPAATLSPIQQMAKSCPPLHKEFVAHHTRDNVVLVTWANFHYLDFALNWVSHMRKLNMHNYMVGAMDEKMADALHSRDIPCFSMGAGLTTGDFGWGSPTFHKMGREKISLANTFVSYGVDLLLSDIDTVYMKDPTEYTEQYPEADIMSSSDHLFHTTTDGGLEDPGAAHSAMNIGIMFFRHGPHTLQLLKEWDEAIQNDPKYWDQNAFNDIARKGMTPHRNEPGAPQDSRYFLGNNKKLKIGILPVSRFCSGHTFFVQKMPQEVHQEPYAVHATFQFGGTAGKRNRLRESGEWFDPPEYYRGRFLSFEFQGVDREWDDTGKPDEEMYNKHFEVVRLQLEQLKTAFAVAHATGRTLVIPKLTCYCDRYWAPLERCRIPGVKMQMPYECPLDHLIEPLHLDLHPAVHGMKLEYREHSFLDNPRMDAEVLASKKDATFAPGEPFSIPQGLQDRALVAALAEAPGGLQDAGLLHFKSVVGGFGGFTNPKDSSEFNKRMGFIGGYWCCEYKKPYKGVQYNKFLSSKLW